ncbi:MAG: GNAT family N-acetyltransferase [Bradymonadia bacterium]
MRRVSSSMTGHRGALLSQIVTPALREALESEAFAAALAPVGVHPWWPGSQWVARPGHFSVWHPTISSTMTNEVPLSVEPEPFADAPEGAPLKLCVGPWAKAPEAVSGFRTWQAEALAITPTVRAQTSAQVSRVDASAYTPAHCALWGLSEMEREALERAQWATPRWLYAARVDGQVVGVSSTLLLELDGRRYAYLSGAVVAPEARGRGLYRQLTEVRLSELAQAGVELAVTLARTATSAPLLKKRGFRHLYDLQCFSNQG